jgi:LacI family transcriptional regulator
MQVLPRRHSLASQVVEILQAEIERRTWGEWLPSERELAERLHVSRNTLRAALAQLAGRGVIESRHPVGTRIVRAAPRGVAARTHTVGLLSPEPFDLFRPNVALIMDELRAQFGEIGVRLRAHHGPRYSGANPGRALARLVAEQPHDCWVLVMTGDEAKRWFLASRVPCVVSGSVPPDLALPSVDLDYRAICRHAAGQMIGAGHRRLGLLLERSSRTGILECQRGFGEAVQAAAGRGVTAETALHQNTPASLVRALERLVRGADAPTALLVPTPHHFLFAHTWLQQRGRAVARDISLVCPDDDPFLAYAHPAPTRYLFDAHAFAGRLFRLVQRVIEGEVIAKPAQRLMPEYFRGESLAAPRAKAP